MNLFKLDKALFTPNDKVFKESGLGTAAFTAGILLTAVGFIVWYLRGELPFIFLIVILCGLLLAGLITGAATTRSRQTTNWLLACNGKRLLIKYRSYLNTNFPADDPQVVYIAINEIKSVRKSVVRLRITGPDGPTRVTLTYLDIAVNADLSILRERLAYERKLLSPSGTAWRDYPVSVLDDSTIRLDWRGIRPKISGALEVIAPNTRLSDSQSETLDLTKPGALSKADLDSRILQLTESGRIMDAVVMARTAYGYDLKEARQFVDELMG